MQTVLVYVMAEMYDQSWSCSISRLSVNGHRALVTTSK